MHDVIIIGGGFAGLSAAALLSRRGQRVLLVEQASLLGGRAAYFEEDGFVWQYGQHSHRLARDGIAAQLFERLGEPLDFIDTRGADAYLYIDGRLHPRPEGPLDFLRTRLLPWRSRLTLLRLLAKMLRARPDEWYNRSLLDFYRTWFSDGHVERLLSFLGFTIMAPDPTLASAGEVIEFMQRAAKAKVKQGEPRGGSKQVIDTLTRVAAEHDCALHLSERVDRIVIKDKRAVGVETNGGRYEARHIVFAAPVFHLFEVAEEQHFDPAFVTYAKGIESSRGLSIDFVFDEPVTTIKGGIIGVDVPLWVKFQTNIDPTVAPPGKHVHTWGMLFPFGAPLTSRTVAQTEARMKAIMEEVMPGALGKVVRERKLVIPVINANVLKPSQSYPHRPEVVCKDVDGLYLIGDTTRVHGCSGDLSFASAMALTDSIGG